MATLLNECADYVRPDLHMCPDPVIEVSIHAPRKGSDRNILPKWSAITQDIVN